MPGLDNESIKLFPIDEIRNSPAAITMLVKLYEELQAKHETQSQELELERFRSRDRLVSSILLLISQIVIAIGVNLLNNHVIAGSTVIAAGALQASLAIFLTFRSRKG